jgi:guanylate kinase
MAAGAFLEWAEVHGRLYGTPRHEVEDFLSKGVGVILDIDVQGAAQVRRLHPDNVSIFVCTSDALFAQRLRQRGTEDEADIARRLANAQKELAHMGEYRHVVRNDDLEMAVAQLSDLVARQF